RAVLSYHGSEATRINQRLPDYSVFAKVPEGWERRLRVQGLSGPAAGDVEISPTRPLTRTVYLHPDYAKIPTGQAAITVTWFVYAPGEGHPLIARPTATIEVDVPPASPERLAVLHKRMEKTLHQTDLLDRDRLDLIQDTLDTRHHALAPLAWELIENGRS